jgi:hypothetical protein
MIYFIRCADRIKIGFSENPKVRLGKISADAPYPCALLGAVEGGKDVENELHAKWKQHRAHGEWFHDVPEITEWVLLRSSYTSNAKGETQFCGFFVPRGFPKIVSARLGVSRAAICRWKEVPLKYCFSIAELLGVSAVDLRPDLYTGWTSRLDRSVPEENLWRHGDLVAPSIPFSHLDGGRLQ